MPNELTRERAIEVARNIGAVSYTLPPTRAIVGLSFTYDQLEVFATFMFKEGRRAALGERA